MFKNTSVYMNKYFLVVFLGKAMLQEK